jgi:F0F1-type ATP synthase assembly protein I
MAEWDDHMNGDRVPHDKEASHFWRLVAVALSLGWNLVIPIVGGVLLGSFLDKRAGGGLVWTIGLLFTGVAVSLYNLYHILFKEIKE